MNGGDGGRLSEVVADLRSIRPHIHIVGNSGESREREFVEAGVDAFLMKPWRVSEFVGLLSR